MLPLRALAFLLVASCMPLPERKPTVPEVPPDPLPPAKSEVGVALASHPELRVLVRAPARVEYEPRAIGASPLVRLRVTNTAPRAAHVGALHVAFAASRDGVELPCLERDERTPRAREPATLGPGESFVYVRDIDCTLPLPGHYELRVFVGLARERDLVARLPLDIAPHANAPKAYPAKRGLYAVMTGAPATRPLPPEGWARGDYSVIVAFINASAGDVALGNAKLSFLVRKEGSRFVCASASESLAAPPWLESGRMYIARVPVRCAPDEVGRYEISGWIGLGGDDEIEIGRVDLSVTSDPRLFTPIP
jgi:hypothetical protein